MTAPGARSDCSITKQKVTDARYVLFDTLDSDAIIILYHDNPLPNHASRLRNRVVKHGRDCMYDFYNITLKILIIIYRLTLNNITDAFC